jgi:ubiquinone/menaquinone biosynthesis C-methylase UbiE
MTVEQLKVPIDTQSWHAEKFGYANTEFLLGDIEKLEELNIAPNSVDVIILNCLINLCLNKEAVLGGCRRICKSRGCPFRMSIRLHEYPSLSRETKHFGENASGAPCIGMIFTTYLRNEASLS